MRRAGLLGVAGIGLVARAAFAQDPAPAPTTPAPTPSASSSAVAALPEVRVVGAGPDALQKLPGSGTVITTKELERAAPYDAAEMLRRVPGLQVREDEGGGGRLDIGVRGLDPGRSRNVLILEDGIPVTVNPYAEPDLYYLPQMERMAGIEVVKGSGAILFGPQTTGGVINFVTLAPPTSPHASVDVTGGNFGYRRAVATYGDAANEHTRYIVQILDKSADGPRGEAYRTIDAFGKLVFDTSKHGQATLKLGIQNNDSDSDDVGLTRQMWITDPTRQTLAPNDHANMTRYEASLIHEQHIGDDTVLRTLLYGYVTDRIWRRQDYSRNFLGTTLDHAVGTDEANVGGAIYFAPTDTILDRSYSVAGLEPRLEHRFRTGDVGHTLDVGARFLTESAHYQQRAGDNPTSYSGELQFEETHRTLAAAAYAQDRVALRDTLLITPGVRFEHSTFTRDTLRQQVGTTFMDTPGAIGTTSNDAIIPGFGAILGTPAAHAFAGVHVGYGPPRLTSSISPRGATTQLAPERGFNYELGARFSQRRWLHVEGTFFYSTFTNQVVAQADDTGTELTNGGETRHYGLETAAVLSLAHALHTKTEIDLGTRYTFAHATFVGGPYAGNFLPYAPLASWTTTLDVNHPLGFGGEIAWTHVSSQFVDQANTVLPDATGRYGIIPQWNTIDLGARYKHKPTGLSLKLTVKNALDQPFIIARRPEGIFASGFRQVFLSLRWDWDAHRDP